MSDVAISISTTGTNTINQTRSSPSVVCRQVAYYEYDPYGSITGLTTYNSDTFGNINPIRYKGYYVAETVIGGIASGVDSYIKDKDISKAAGSTIVGAGLSLAGGVSMQKPS